MIHELLVHFAEAKEPLFLSFDWGSQSIAQCNFQRSLSRLGKEFKSDKPLRHRQHLFLDFFGDRVFFAAAFFKELPRSTRRFQRRVDEGVRTMEISSTPTSPF